MSTPETATEPPRPAGDEHLLTVRDLRVSFATEEGVVQAVDGVSFDLAAGEVLAVVGESGSGKSVSAMTLMGLTRSPNASFEGTAHYKGTELIAASEDRAAARPRRRDRDDLPGPDDLAEPGAQDREPDHRADPGARGASRPAGARARDRAARQGRDPARPRPARLLPARVLGRHAPARDDRARALLRPVDPDRGRADHGARRDDPGPDPRSASASFATRPAPP